MRRIYFSIALTPFFFSAFSQTVTKEQTPLVVKKTATWCTPCGTWGWELFDEIWNEAGDKSVILEMHNSSSSALFSSDALAFYGLHEPKSSTPVFYVNTKNKVAYSASGGIYPSATKTNILNAVNATNSLTPVVNSGFAYSTSGNELKINTKVRFFQNATGEYYLGVYVVEDNVQASQSGISGIATHKRILRASVTPNIEGTLISNGSVSIGEEFIDSITFTLNSSWDTNNIKVFTVIWKKVGTKFHYENATIKQGILSVKHLIKNELNVNLYPNISSGDQEIMLDVKGTSNEALTIEVFNQVGAKINTVFTGLLKSDKESFNVNPTKSLSKGLYFVNIVSNKNTSKTLKMIIL